MHPVWTHETRILCDLVGTQNRIVGGDPVGTYNSFIAVIQLCHRTVF
jgi:hypothetical protein